MSVEIKYDLNRNVIDVSISGTTDLDELYSTFENIINSGEYDPDTKVIWDIRKTDVSSINYQFIASLVEIRSFFIKRKHGRSVLIASSDLHYGLGRMLQTLSGTEIDSQFMVFRDYEKGEQWLLEGH